MINEATQKLAASARAYEKTLISYVCPIYGVQGSRAQQIGSGFLLRTRSSIVLVTASHVLQELRRCTLHMPAGSRIVPIEGDPFATRLTLVGETYQYGDDVGFVILDVPRMEASPSTPTLCVEDLDVADVSQSQTAYGCVGTPGSVNQASNGIFDAQGYFYGGLAATDDEYEFLRYRHATHFIMKFDHSNMIDERDREVLVPEPYGMSGGPIFRVGTFDQILSGTASPRLIAITIEWWQTRKVMVGVRVAMVLTAIRQLVPSLAPELPDPVYFESVIQLDPSP